MNTDYKDDGVRLLKVATFLADNNEDFKLINRLKKTKSGQRELQSRGAFIDYFGDEISKTFVNNCDMVKLDKIVKNMEKTVFVLGLWEENDSFVFMDTRGDSVFCVRREFLEELLDKYKPGEKLN